MIRVFHVDIRATEGQLMRALNFAQILRQLIIRSRVCLAGDGAAVAPGESASCHCYADVGLCERLHLDSEIGPRSALVSNFLDCGACNRCAEVADRSRTDQI